MADHDDDLPPSEEELAASARLRDALEGLEGAAPSEDAELAHSLREAFAPKLLAKDDNDLLIALALASEEEVAAAAHLRDHGDPVISALEAAWRPSALGDREHAAIVAAAIRERKERGVVIRVAFGAGGVLALAASVLLFVRVDAASPEAPLARARSTQPLFGEPFKPGDASARIDRIAIARASDYRDNRFAKWGVR